MKRKYSVISFDEKSRSKLYELFLSLVSKDEQKKYVFLDEIVMVISKRLLPKEKKHLLNQDVWVVATHVNTEENLILIKVEANEKLTINGSLTDLKIPFVVIAKKNNTSIMNGEKVRNWVRLLKRFRLKGKIKEMFLE